MKDALLEEPYHPAPTGSTGHSGDRGAMRMLSCVIRPESLEAVTTALNALGVGGMTVTDVRGFGRQKGQVEHYRGGEYVIRFLPKVRIDVAVRADEVDAAMAAIKQSAHTGQVGDGKVFVNNVHNAVRIRTGERGINAL